MIIGKQYYLNFLNYQYGKLQILSILSIALFLNICWSSTVSILSILSILQQLIIRFQRYYFCKSILQACIAQRQYQYYIKHRQCRQAIDINNQQTTDSLVIVDYRQATLQQNYSSGSSHQLPLKAHHYVCRYLLEFVFEISEVSFGSNQTFFLPHLRTEAASLFCSLRELKVNRIIKYDHMVSYFTLTPTLLKYF